jgi:hypothetical protein
MPENVDPIKLPVWLEFAVNPNPIALPERVMVGEWNSSVIDLLAQTTEPVSVRVGAVRLGQLCRLADRPYLTLGGLLEMLGIKSLSFQGLPIKAVGHMVKKYNNEGAFLVLSEPINVGGSPGLPVIFNGKDEQVWLSGLPVDEKDPISLSEDTIVVCPLIVN